MTGLLYFIVIAMWASVLIPIGLKNHDRRNLEKSLLPEGQQPIRWHWQAREKLSPRQRAFVRRRRVAMTLLSLFVGSIVLASTGTISAAWVVLPTGLLGGFGYAAAKRPQPKKIVRPVSKQTLVDEQKTQIVPLSTIVVERILEEKVEVQKRTWIPVETPLPNYVATEGAANFARRSKASRPWTDQEMVNAAAQLRQQRAEKLKEAQVRLEEARALAMENARRAAMAANQNNGVTVTPFRRASNQ